MESMGDGSGEMVPIYDEYTSKGWATRIEATYVAKGQALLKKSHADKQG